MPEVAVVPLPSMLLVSVGDAPPDGDDSTLSSGDDTFFSGDNSPSGGGDHAPTTSSVGMLMVMVSLATPNIS